MPRLDQTPLVGPKRPKRKKKQPLAYREAPPPGPVAAHPEYWEQPRDPIRFQPDPGMKSLPSDQYERQFISGVELARQNLETVFEENTRVYGPGVEPSDEDKAFENKNVREARETLALAQRALRDYRRGRARATASASMSLTNLVRSVPENLLLDSPYTYLYLHAASRDAPEVIYGAVNATKWLKQRYGAYLSQKATSTVLSDPQNQRQFDAWINQQMRKRAEQIPDNEQERQMWVDDLVREGIATGKLPVDADPDEQSSFSKRAVALALESGGLPPGLFSPGQEPQPQGAESGFVWRVPESFYEEYPMEFGYLQNKVLLTHPGLDIQIVPDDEYLDGNERVALKAERLKTRRVAEATKPGLGDHILGALSLGLGGVWDVVTFLPNVLGRYGTEFRDELFDPQNNRVESPIEMYREYMPAQIRHLPQLVTGDDDFDFRTAYDEELKYSGLRLGNVVARAAGFEPGDPGWERAQIYGSIVGDVFLTAIGGGAIRGARLAKTQPIGEATVVWEQSMLTGGLKPKLRGALPIDPVTGKLAYPRNKAAARVWQLLGKTPEEFYATKTGRAVVDTILELGMVAGVASPSRRPAKRSTTVRAVEKTSRLKNSEGRKIAVTDDALDLGLELKEKAWGVIGAKDAASYQKLGRELREVGFNPIEVSLHGIPAWYVPGMRTVDAVEMARPYGASSVLTPDGVITLRGERTISRIDWGEALVGGNIMQPDLMFRLADGSPMGVRLPLKEASAMSAEVSAQAMMSALPRTQMTIEDAVLLGNATTAEAVTEILIAGHRGGKMTPHAYEAWANRMHAVEDQLTDPALQLAPDVERDLLAEHYILSQRQARVALPARIAEYPSMKNLNRAMDTFPESRSFMGKAIRTIMGGVPINGLRMFRLSRFNQNLPQATIESPFHPQARPDAATHGLEQIDNLLNYLEVSDDIKTSIKAKWVGMRHADDLFEVMRDVGEAIRLSLRIDPMVADTLSTLYRSQADDIVRGKVSIQVDTPTGRSIRVIQDTLPEVRRVWDEAAGEFREITHALPAWPSELVQYIPLLSIKDLAEATSLFKRVVRHAGVEKPFLALQHMADAMGVIWKKGVLGMRALGGALPLRIQGEQLLGRFAAMDQATIVRHPRTWLRSLRSVDEFAGHVDVPEQTLGAIIRDHVAETTQTVGPIARRNQVYRPGAPNTAPYFRAWADRLHFLSSDPLARYLARNGKAATKIWLEGKGANVYDAMRPSVERAGLTLDEYLERLDGELSYITAESPQLRRAIGSGKIDRPSVINLLIDPADDAALRMQQRELADLDGLPDTPDIKRRRLQAKARIRAANNAQKSPEIDLSTTASSAEVLEDLANGGVVIPPSEVGAAIGVAEPAAIALFSKAGGRGLMDKIFRWGYSNPDVFLSRKPLWRQFARQEEVRALNMGASPVQARKIGARAASHQAADMLYDLAARTSGQFFLRNIAPFFPAWQELMTTWLSRIPKYMGGGSRLLGGAILHRRAADIVNLLKETPVIDEAEDGSLVVPVPFVGNLLEALTGYEGEIKTELRAGGFSLIGSDTLLPGLGPWPSAFVADMVQRHDGAYDVIGNQMLPFGTDVSFGPTALNRLWTAAFGQAPPWEFASRDYLEWTYQHALEDGMVMARQQIGAAPKPGKRLNQLSQKAALSEDEQLEFNVLNTKHKEAMGNWYDEIQKKGEQNAKTVYLIRGLGNMMMPSTLQVTPDFVEERTKFWEEYNAAAEDADKGALFDKFLEEHPDMTWALVPKTKVRVGQQRTQYLGDDRDGSFQTYLEDHRNRRIEEIPPEDWPQIAFASESYRLYTARKRKIMESYGTAPNLLANWADYTRQIEPIELDWQRTQFYNPEAFVLSQQLRNDAAAGNPDVPQRTMRQEQLVEVAKGLKALGEFFENDFGVKDKEFQAVIGVVREALELGDFQNSGSPIERGLDWWWRNVGEPYFTFRGQQIDRIKGLEEDQQTPGWEALRRQANAEVARTGPDGQEYPTPEEFSWGNLTPEQQEFRRVKLATKRLEWLTNFERRVISENVGSNQGFVVKGKGDEKISKIADVMNEEQAKLNRIIASKNLHTSSKEAELLKEQADANIMTAAKKLGKDAVNFYLWTQQPIHVRLDQLNLFTSPSWGNVIKNVNLSHNIINSSGFSPKGGGQVAMSHYDWIEKAVNAERSRSPEFDDEMSLLEAVTEKNRRDMYLWIFYGRWRD